MTKNGLATIEWVLHYAHDLDKIARLEAANAALLENLEQAIRYLVTNTAVACTHAPPDWFASARTAIAEAKQ